jgi:hypothetical protein
MGDVWVGEKWGQWVLFPNYNPIITQYRLRVFGVGLYAI